MRVYLYYLYSAEYTHYPKIELCELNIKNRIDCLRCAQLHRVMQTLRCSGRRDSDNKRCSRRVKKTKPTDVQVWCYMHFNQRKIISSGSKSPEVTSPELTSNEVTTSNEECPICFDIIEDKDDAELKCKHKFHLDCIKQLHNTSCPMCRAPLESLKIKESDFETINQRKQRNIEENEQRDFEALYRLVFPVESRVNDYIATAYLNMLEALTANLPDDVEERTDPMSMMERLNTAVMVTSAVVGDFIPRHYIHDMLLEDIPPLFPHIDANLIHEQIHQVLGLAPS